MQIEHVASRDGSAHMPCRFDDTDGVSSEIRTNPRRAASLHTRKTLSRAASLAATPAASNSSMVLNEKYYNQLEDTTSYAERAQKYIDTIEDTVVRDNHQLYLDSIKKMYSYRNNLLKRYRNKKNPLEVDAHHMLSSTRDKIKKLEEDIQEAKLQLKVPGIDEDIVESSISTERKPNESFEKSLILD